MTESGSNSTGIDKNALWGWWRSTQQWQEKLQRKAAHKALDIPDDEMQIKSTTNNTGIGAMGAVGIALAAAVPGLGALAVVAPLLLKQLDQPTKLPPVVTQPGPVDSDYVVRFYDADGNPIEVPQKKATNGQ